MFCNQNAYTPKLLDPRNVLQKIHTKTGTATRKLISKQDFLQPYFDCEFSDVHSSRIAQNIERYIKITKKYQRETKFFVEAVLNKIYLLHKYNLKVAEVTFKYPLTSNFTQLLMRYVVLECSVLYKREHHTPRYEILVEERILKLLQTIYNSYLESLNSIPPEKLFKERCVAILNLFIKIKFEFEIQNDLMENIAKKLLIKMGRLEQVNALKKRCIPCPLDTFLSDPAVLNTYKNIITSDYGTDDNLKIEEEIIQVDTQNEDNDSNQELDIKQDIGEILRVSNRIQENAEMSSNQIKKVPTIYIDDDNEEMIVLEEEIETSSRSTRRQKAEEEKKLMLREKQYEMFSNHKPFDDVKPYVKNEVIDLNSDEESSTLENNSNSNNNRVNNINTVRGSLLVDEIVILDDDADSILVQPYIMSDSLKAVKESNEVDILELSSDDEEQFNVIPKEEEEELLRDETEDNLNSSLKSVEDSKIISNTAINNVKTAQSNTSNVNAVEIQEDISQAAIEKFNISVKNAFGPLNVSLPLTDTMLSSIEDTLDTQLENIDIENKTLEDNVTEERQLSNDRSEETQHEIILKHDTLRDNETKEEANEDIEKKSTYDKLQIIDKCKGTDDILEKNSIENSSFEIELKKNETQNETSENNFHTKITDLNVNSIEMRNAKILNGENIKHQDMSYSEKGTSNDMQTIAEYTNHTDMSERNQSTKECDKAIEDSAVSNPLLDIVIQKSEGLSLAEQLNEHPKEKTLVSENLIVPVTCSIDICRDPLIEEKCLTLTFKENALTRSEVIEENHNSFKLLKQNECNVNILMEETEANDSDNTITEVSEVEENLLKNDDVLISNRPLEVIKDSEIVSTSSECKSQVEENITYQSDENEEIVEELLETTPQIISGHTYELSETDLCQNEDVGTNNFVKDEINVPDETVVTNEETTHKLGPNNIEQITEDQDSLETSTSSYKIEESLKDEKSMNSDEKLQGNIENNIERTDDATKDESSVSSTDEVKDHIVMNSNNLIELTVSNEERINLDNKDNNLNKNDVLEIPSDIELNQKKSLDESSVKQFPDQIKNFEQLNTNNMTIFNKIQTETIERQDDGDKTVKDINELQESENDNDACKNQIEGAHSTQTSETKEQPVSEQVLEETIEISAEMDVSQQNTECFDKNMTENERTIENCESIHSVSENDTSEKDHKKQCKENKITEESTDIKDNSTANLFETSSKALDKVEQLIEEPNENFLGKKIYKNEEDTTINSQTEKLAEETFSPLNLQTNENNEMEEIFQFQSTEHEIEVATEDIEHFELIQQEVNKNDTTVTEQQYLNKKTIDKEENVIINKLETSEVELFQENKFEVSMCHKTGENHFETIDSHKNVIAATEEQHVKENMTEEENGIHKLETPEIEVCSENTYEDNMCHKTENHLEIVKSTKNYSTTREKSVNEKITVEETNIDKLEKSEIEVCSENTYENNINHITENNFEIITSTKNYSKATDDNANEKIMVEENGIIDKLETSEVEVFPENTHEGNICYEIDQNDFETVDSNKNDTTATEEQHVNEKLTEEEENGIIHKLKTSEIKVFTENTYEDNICHKTDVNRFETVTTTDSEIAEEICYEKYNESNLIDDLNIQKEEIIVEDTLELGASEEIIMNEDHSGSCTREATDGTTPNNNEQSRRDKIIPIAIKIEEPLMKKEEIEINTRITNNQILPKVGQHLEICAIPDENTSLDILATVASEMSRQHLLKTRKEKKKKVSHKRRKKQFDLKSKLKGVQKRQNNSNIKLKEALDVSADVENKRVTRSAQKEKKPEFYQEPKCKPHDFVITNNSGAPPPSNNIYTQKLSDVPLTSEDSNDSEGNLLIDEDIDVKSIKLNPLQSSKKLACYDEDTMEENINLCCEPKVRGTVLISIPDIYQGNFEFLTQMEQLDKYPNHSFGKEDIDIQNNRNFTADKIYLSDSLKNNKIIPDAKSLINTEIGNSQKTEYPILIKKNHKPFRTKAEQKDYDKFSLKPYVSIERLNITSKNEEKQKYIRSKSIDMGVIRNIGNEQTSNNMDNTIVENRVLKNKPAISTEVENLKLIKDEILKQEIKNLPCVKRDEDSDDDIPLSQRNHLEIKQMKKSVVSSKCINESKKEKSSHKTNEKTEKEKNNDKPKPKSRKKRIGMKEYKDDARNLTKKLVNEEKSTTLPNNIHSSSASSITQTSIHSTASCSSMEKDICSTSFEISTVKNDESESILQSNFQVQCGGRSYEEFMKSSNTKYYTTPKLRRKSVSRHNLNRNEKNSDIKFEETKQVIFNTDKKYYTPPKLRRKSMIESDIKSENTTDAKRTTPKQIKLSTSKVDILSKCKNTISPTTEKLKKKLEIDFKLNCTAQESSDNSLQKLPEISGDSDKMPNPEKVNSDTKSISINSTTVGDQLSSNVYSNSFILDVNKQNICEELSTVEANITNPTKSELNINISPDPNTSLNEKETNIPHEVGKITSANSSLTQPTEVHQTQCGEEEKLSSLPEFHKRNAIAAKPKMLNNSETFKNQQTIPKENMEIKSDSGTNSSKDALIENEDENLDDLPLATRTTISNQGALNNPKFKNEIKSHKKSSKKIVSIIGTENRQQNKCRTHTGNIKIKHKNVITSKSKAKQTKKVRKSILNKTKIVKRGSRTGKINRKLNILRKSKMLNDSKHRGNLSKKRYKNKIELSSVEVLKKTYDKTETSKQNLNMYENIPPQPTSVKIYKMPIDEFKNKKQSVLYLNQDSLSKRNSDSVVQLEEGMENILIKNVKEKESTVNEKVEIYPQIETKPALEKSVSVSEQHVCNKENTIDKLYTKTELISKNVIKGESSDKQLTKLPASHASEDTADHLGVCKNSNNPKLISSKLYLNSVLPKNKNKNDYPKTWKKEHSESPPKKSFAPILKPIKTKTSNKMNRVKTALTEKKMDDVVLENCEILTSLVKTTNNSDTCTQKNKDKKLVEKTDKNCKKRIFNKITKSTKSFKTMENTKEEEYSKMLIKDKANKSKNSDISQMNKCSKDLTAVEDLNDNLTEVSLVVINEEIVDSSSCKTGNIKKSNIELNLKKLVKKTEEKTSDMDILVSEDIKTTIVNEYIPLTNDQLDSKSQRDVPVEYPLDVKHSSHTNEILMINESVDTMNHELGTDSKVDMPIEKPMDIKHSSYSNEEMLIVNEEITIKSSNVNENICSVNHELHSEPQTYVPVENPVDGKDSSHVNEEFSVINEEVDTNMNHELGTESEVDMPIEKPMDIKHSTYSNEEILIVNEEVTIKSSNVNENISSVNHELHSEPQTDVPVENPVDVKDSCHVNEEISVINEEVDTKTNHELDTKSEIDMSVEKPLNIKHSSHVNNKISVLNEEVDTKSSNISGNISSVYHELDSEPHTDVPVENPVDVKHSSHVNKEISVKNEEVDIKMIHELDTKSEINTPIENPLDIKRSSHTSDKMSIVNKEVTIKSFSVNENITSVNHELHSEPQTDVPVENPVDIKHSSHINEDILVIYEEMDTKMNHELGTNSEIDKPVENPLDIKRSSHTNDEMLIVNKEVTIKSSSVNENISSVNHELHSEPQTDVPVENPVDVKQSSHLNEEISMINEVDTEKNHELDAKSEIDMPVEKPQDIKHSSHAIKEEEEITVVNEILTKIPNIHDNISTMNHEMDNKSQTNVFAENPVDIKQLSHCNEEISVINEQVDTKSSYVNNGFLMNHKLDIKSHTDMLVPNPVHIKHSFHATEEISIIMEESDTKLDTPVKSVEISLENIPSTINEKVLSSNQDAENKTQLDNVNKCDNTLQENSTEYEPTDYTVTIPLEKVSEIKNILVEKVKESEDFGSSNMSKVSLLEENNIVALDVEHESKKVQMLSDQSMICINEVINHNLEESKSMLLNNDPKQLNLKIKCKIDSSVNQLDNSTKDDALDENLHLETKQQMEKMIDKDDLDTISAMSINVEETLVQSIESQEDCVETVHISQLTKEIIEKDSISPLIETKKVEESKSAKITKTENKLLVSAEIIEHDKLQNKKQLIDIKQDSVEDNSTCLEFNKICENTVANIKLANAEATTNDYFPAKAENEFDLTISDTLNTKSNVCVQKRKRINNALFDNVFTGKKSKLLEIKIDVSTSGFQDAINTSTKLHSPLSTSPRKKDKKSIECIINQLKEEKEGSVEANEELIKSPLSSPFKVDVGTLKKKLSQKIRGQNSLKNVHKIKASDKVIIKDQVTQPEQSTLNSEFIQTGMSLSDSEPMKLKDESNIRNVLTDINCTTNILYLPTTEIKCNTAEKVSNKVLPGTEAIQNVQESEMSEIENPSNQLQESMKSEIVEIENDNVILINPVSSPLSSELLNDSVKDITINAETSMLNMKGQNKDMEIIRNDDNDINKTISITNDESRKSRTSSCDKDKTSTENTANQILNEKETSETGDLSPSEKISQFLPINGIISESIPLSVIEEETKCTEKSVAKPIPSDSLSITPEENTSKNFEDSFSQSKKSFSPKKSIGESVNSCVEDFDSTNVETNLLNLCDLMLHVDSAGNVTRRIEESVTSEAVCMLSDIISTTISSTANKLPCVSSPATIKFTFPVTSQANIKEQFVPMNEVVTKKSIFDDNSISTDKLSRNKNGNCLFSLNEQINSTTSGALASSSISLNLQEVDFSKIPIDSTQPFDLISPNSMMQTSSGNDFINEIPVDNEVSDITEIRNSNTIDHNYTMEPLGGPLLSGRPEEEHIFSSAFNKILVDSPGEFPLNDNQLPSELSESDDTYKLNLDNEYAVKNLVMLGGQTSDVKSFPLSNYNLSDIERMNLIEDSISSSEENSNSLDTASLVTSMEQESRDIPNNAWAQFIVDESSNQAVTVPSCGPRLTSPFSISQNDLIEPTISTTPCFEEDALLKKSVSEMKTSDKLSTSSLEQLKDNDPWAQFIANENLNQKVVVLPNEQFLTSFPISQNSFIQSTTLMTSCVDNEIILETPELNIEKKQIKLDVPKDTKKSTDTDKKNELTEMETAKCNLKKNKKPKQSSQKDVIRNNDFLPKRTYSRTVLRAPLKKSTSKSTDNRKTFSQNKMIQIKPPEVILEDKPSGTILFTEKSLPDVASIITTEVFQTDLKQNSKDVPASLPSKRSKLDLSHQSSLFVQNSSEASSTLTNVINQKLATVKELKQPVAETKNCEIENSTSTILKIKETTSNTAKSIVDIADKKPDHLVSNTELIKSRKDSVKPLIDVPDEKPAQLLIEVLDKKSNVHCNIAELVKSRKRAVTNKYSNNYSSPSPAKELRSDVAKSKKIEKPLSCALKTAVPVELVQQERKSCHREKLEKLLEKPTKSYTPQHELDTQVKSAVKEYHLGLDNSVSTDNKSNKPNAVTPEPCQSVSKSNHSIESILNKEPKFSSSCVSGNSVKDYKPSKIQGVKRTLSTAIEDDETEKKQLKISCVESRQSLAVAENNENQKKPVKPSSVRPQLDTNIDKTFDSLLQQGNVNKLILLRVTEDNKLKPERKYSPLLKPGSAENSLESKLKAGRNNAPVRLSSKSRELNEVTKKEIERRANLLLKSHSKSRDLDPLRTDKSSPLVKSDSRNKEQREYKHTRSSFHSEYNWPRDGSSSRTKSREETRYSSYTSLRSDKGKDQYYSEYHRRREAYHSDHVRGKEAHYSGYSGRREGHHSDHSRTREHHEHGSGSIPRTSSTTLPATGRSSNVSGSYYKSIHLDQGEEQTSHSSSRHSSGPYMKRGATLTQEKQNELLNALRDMVHKQLNSSGFKKSSAEEDYSWLDKLKEFNETPQFVPQPSNPPNERK